MPNDADERTARLRATKLSALVTEHRGGPGDGLEPAASIAATGAALLDGPTAWVHLAERPTRRIGAALAWSLRRGAERVAIVVDDPADAAVIVRRVDGLDLEVEVFVAVGRRLERRSDAAPLPTASALPARHLELRPSIVEGGATPVVEHGVLIGEVHGLEVCRVVDDVATGEVRLEVGVGVHDREAFQMVHGEVPAVESLARVVEAVAARRVEGAPHHPLNRLSPERFLRWRLMRTPSLVGAVELAPTDSPLPRGSLLDVASCVASGTGADGGPVLVVCGIGTDVELVPDALDARRAAGVEWGGRMVVATSAGDRLAIVDDLAALAAQSFELASI